MDELNSSLAQAQSAVEKREQQLKKENKCIAKLEKGEVKLAELEGKKTTSSSRSSFELSLNSDQLPRDLQTMSLILPSIRLCFLKLELSSIKTTYEVAWCVLLEGKTGTAGLGKGALEATKAPTSKVVEEI